MKGAKGVTWAGPQSELAETPTAYLVVSELGRLEVTKMARRYVFDVAATLSFEVIAEDEQSAKAQAAKTLEAATFEVWRPMDELERSFPGVVMVTISNRSLEYKGSETE